MELPKFPLERVLWLDHSTEHGWGKGENWKPSDLEVCSVGFIVAETPKAITLAPTISAEGYYLCPIDIHKRLILERTVLRKARA